MTRPREDSWRAINRRLHALTEDEALAVLQAEMVGSRRVVVVERLHQRYSMLRSQRERRELMEKLNGQLGTTRNPPVSQPAGAEAHPAPQPAGVAALGEAAGGPLAAGQAD